MWFHALACDYDGTLATGGRVAPETVDALRRARESGRRLMLVTGRVLDDLLAVFPALDVFDFAVAENGAVLYDPKAKQAVPLAPPPPPPLLAGLEHAGVPYSTGRVVVATVVPHETAVLQTIRTLGLELEIVFNREAVMILPTGVSKASGLAAALARLGISRHNVVGVGDAENDHAFLRCVGFGVAVANAVTSLAAVADHVTAAPAGAGVVELIDELVETDLAGRVPRRGEPAVTVGEDAAGRHVPVRIRGPNLLITGGSGTGKSTLTGVLVERLVQEEYVVCLLDPEGDYRSLAAQEGMVVLTTETGTAEQRAEEVDELLRHRATSVTIDLSALDREERIRAAAAYLHAVQRLRAHTGSRCWLVIDEAHHVFPPTGGPAEHMFDRRWSGVCLVTNEPDRVAPRVLASATRIVSTSLAAVTDLLPLVTPAQVPGGELEPGEALDVVFDGGAPAVVTRFRVVRRETAHRRHVKKYATGRLPPERAFHFREPDGALDLVAHNLETFAMLARGIDDRTWLHHLRCGDVSRWLREAIRDPELADEIARLERGTDADATREAALQAIGRRYTPV